MSTGMPRPLSILIELSMNEYFYRSQYRQRFVDGVINDLVNQMMKSQLAGEPMPWRPLARPLTIENRNRSCAVLLLICCHALLL
jgi:hypothetical protein